MSQGVAFLDLEDLPKINELRKYPRAYFTVAVTLEIDGRLLQAAECRNISESGMYVSTRVRIPKGIKGSVTLTKKCGDRHYSFSADFIVVRAEVENENHQGIGIEFTRIFDEDRKNLTFIIEYHLAVSMRSKIRISDDGLDGIVFRVARTREELAAAFKVVHDTYVCEGYMEPDPSGMRLSIHHSLPFTTTFLGIKNGEVIVASTLFLDSPIGVPADSIYKKELDELRVQGRLIAEIGAFAVQPGFKQSSPKLVLHLQKLMVLYASQYLTIDDMVITIHPKHRLYYQCIFLFEQYGCEKNYLKVKGSPAILMLLNQRTARDEFFKVYDGAPKPQNMYEFLYVTKNPSIDMPKEKSPVITWDQDLFNYFFQIKTSIGDEADPAMVKSVLKTYEDFKPYIEK